MRTGVLSDETLRKTCRPLYAPRIQQVKGAPSKAKQEPKTHTTAAKTKKHHDAVEHRDKPKRSFATTPRLTPFAPVPNQVQMFIHQHQHLNERVYQVLK